MAAALKIAPSILAADFARLGEEVRAVDAAGADYIHIDVMDGHFVPNITLGPQVVRALRPHSAKPFDVHLMIQPVDPFIEAFAAAGSDLITVHIEAGPHLDRSLQLIRALGKKAGVTMNPATPPAVIEYVLDQVDLVLVMSVNPGFGGQTLIPAAVDKVRRVRAMIGARPIELEVDGGIGPENVGAVAAAGADVIVAGSAIFASADYPSAIADLRRRALAARARLKPEASAVVDREREKQAAAASSMAYVEAGQIVGLGTGSTATHAIRMLGQRVRAGLAIRGVPTSAQTRELARAEGIPLLPLEQVTRVDVTIDGADEVDPQLQLIKGGGGALLHEKIVAAASARLIVIADSGKLVGRLGRFPLPVEVVPGAWRLLAERLKALGCTPTLRRADGGAVYVTDEGNYLLDCPFGAIEDPPHLARALNEMPGVVEHGLFIDMAEVVIIGRGEDAEVLSAGPRSTRRR